jgi:hypothetical protein
VGMKLDLREDPATIGELLKTGQRPVTTKEVSTPTIGNYATRRAAHSVICRALRWPGELAAPRTTSVRPRQEKASMVCGTRAYVV